MADRLRLRPATVEESPTPPEHQDDYDRALADFCRLNCDSIRVRIGARSRSAVVAGLVKAVERARLKARVLVRDEHVYLSRRERQAH